MMSVRKTVLILYLATGLSVGLLSGCNPFSKSQEQPPASSTGTSNQPVTDNQQTPAIENLRTLQQKRTALNTFVANIKVTENGTKVENPVDYAEAKKIVDELATAYKTFKDSLSDDIKTKIGFNNIDSKIEPILGGTSQQRKILEDLAKSQYSEAQNKLSQLEIDSQPIYKQSDIDGEDGSKQRIATKKLLEQILNVTQPLATLKIDNLSEQPTLTAGQLKIQLEQLKKDINRNNWIWPLLNTLALLSVPISFVFLWDMMGKIVLIHKFQKTGKQETDIQRFKNEIVDIKSNLQEMSNELTKYLKNNESKEELKLTLRKIDEVKRDLERIYHDVILQHLDTLDPTQDLIENYAERPTRNFSTPQDNFSLQQLGDLNTKLDKLLQINQQNLSVRYSSENSGLLSQIWHRIQQIPSDSPALSYELEQLKSQLQRYDKKNKELKSKCDQLQHQIDNSSQSENQLKNHEESIKRLTLERDQLQEQLELFNSGEVEQLRKKNQELDSSYQNLGELLYNVNIEKVQLEQQATTLNSQVTQLQQDKKDLELTANENVEEIQKLKKEIDRLRKLLKKEAIETEDIPQQWQNIINSYNKSPDAILNIHGVHKQGEVVEKEDTGMKRWDNSREPVILTPNQSPDGFYVISVGNDYLLFPKQHAIAESQEFTASALFDGYKGGDTRKFTLISPAQVTPVGGRGMWQLKYKGRLEYN
jgi:regulator of replication initiation timing